MANGPYAWQYGAPTEQKRLNVRGFLPGATKKMDSPWQWHFPIFVQGHCRTHPQILEFDLEGDEPNYQVLVTNPPYSGDHKAVNHGAMLVVVDVLRHPGWMPGS